MILDTKILPKSSCWAMRHVANRRALLRGPLSNRCVTLEMRLAYIVPLAVETHSCSEQMFAIMVAQFYTFCFSYLFYINSRCPMTVESSTRTARAASMDSKPAACIKNMPQRPRIVSLNAIWIRPERASDGHLLWTIEELPKQACLCCAKDI